MCEVQSRHGETIRITRYFNFDPDLYDQITRWYQRIMGVAFRPARLMTYQSHIGNTVTADIDLPVMKADIVTVVGALSTNRDEPSVTGKVLEIGRDWVKLETDNGNRGFNLRAYCFSKIHLDNVPQ